MDKEKVKISDTLMKFFESKGVDKKELEEMAEASDKPAKRKLHPTHKIENLKDMLNISAEKYKDEPAFKFKTDEPGKFDVITYAEFADQVNALGTKLIDMGLQGKKIAVIGENRYEWALAYMAVVCGTGIVVPIDKSLPDNEIEGLMIRSGAEAIFYTNTYDKVMNDVKKRQVSDIRYFISMDIKTRKDGINSQKELVEKGKKLLEDGNTKFLDSTINNEEMGFLLFTSGTTSNSKGVMLSHKNICTNVMDTASVLKVTPGDVILSFLPLHHTFECTAGFLFILYSGGAIAYCDGVKHIAANLKEYEITIMVSVPALYEQIYKKVIKTLEQKGKLEDVEKARKLTSILNKVGLDLRKKLFKELHANLGGKLRILISGAAALDEEAERGFNELGFQLSQGYGLTETSPVVSAGDDFDRKLGSVGKVFPSVKVKIDDKNEEGIGEILVKGPSVMMGYYQNEEATKEVLRKGWFYTGDLGYIDKKGFLFICGRKKSVIVLKNGKNIFPEEIESVINRIEGVKESFVYGKSDKGNENDLKLCSKIVYDEEIFKEVYDAKTKAEAEKIIGDKVKELNKTMPIYKYIKDVIVSTDEIIKTTTLKIKRHEELAKIEKTNK